MSVYDQETFTGNVAVGHDLTVGNDANVNGDLNVNGYVNAYNTRQFNVGVFASLSELQAAYPSSAATGMICVPKRGWIGGVISTTNDGTELLVYRYNGVAWECTPLSIDLDIVFNNTFGSYATKSYVDQQLALKADLGAMTTALAAKAATSWVNTQLAAKADASSVYTKEQTVNLLGRSAGENVRVTYAVGIAGDYVVINSGIKPLLIVVDGVGYFDTTKVALKAGSNAVTFVFSDPATIPAGAFKNIGNIERLHIPSFVHSFGNDAFVGTTLKYVDCEGMTPPSNVAAAFNGLAISEVKVHDVVKSRYAAATGWSSYSGIIVAY